MPQWLLERLRDESPDITPDFSLRNSSRWMTALRLLCEDGAFAEDALWEFYAHVQRRRVCVVGDNLVFESTLMSLHYLSSLVRLVEDPESHYHHVRSAVIAWYYGIYYAAIAMLAAADGAVLQTHAGNARAWGRQLRDNNLVCAPFSYGLSSLVKAQCDRELTAMRGANRYSLNDEPTDIEVARGGCISYLKGTAKRERGIVEKAIQSEREFRDLQVDSFRTTRARVYRDRQLSGRTVNFLHQAFRYRGKANYRDAIFMAYGQRQQEWIAGLMVGLESTLAAFLMMSTYYCIRRVERGSWAAFRADLERNARVDVPEWIAR